MGYQVNSRFLSALREASLRQRWTGWVNQLLMLGMELDTSPLWD
jgi:hypothetical protein